MTRVLRRARTDTERRWPRRVFGVGKEPDPRFTFANERTFLAWVRTSLALIAAGVSLDTFVTTFPVEVRATLAVALVLIGSYCGAMAYRRWMVSERALRLGDALPAPKIAPTLAYGVALTGLVVAVVLLARQ
jgi:putative membrane protein